MPKQGASSTWATKNDAHAILGDHAVGWTDTIARADTIIRAGVNVTPGTNNIIAATKNQMSN